MTTREHISYCRAFHHVARRFTSNRCHQSKLKNTGIYCIYESIRKRGGDLMDTFSLGEKRSKGKVIVLANGTNGCLVQIIDESTYCAMVC